MVPNGCFGLAVLVAVRFLSALASTEILKIKAAQELAETVAKYGVYAASLGYAGHEAVRHLFSE